MPSLNQIAQYAEKNLPPGTVLPHGSATVPGGFLPADGAAVSRSVFSALFAVTGVQFGAGDGSTTFNVPNLGGIFARGAGSQTVASVLYDGSTVGTKRKDRTNNAGLSASTTSTNSASVGTYNAAHSHSWNDRFFSAPVGATDSYSDSGGGIAVAVNYTNVETARTTQNPNVSLNHGHTNLINTVVSTSTFNLEDAATVPGFLTAAFIIKV